MNSEEKNKYKRSKEVTIKEGKGGYGGQHKIVDSENSENEEE